jgi:hypothetical protein
MKKEPQELAQIWLRNFTFSVCTNDLWLSHICALPFSWWNVVADWIHCCIVFYYLHLQMSEPSDEEVEHFPEPSEDKVEGSHCGVSRTPWLKQMSTLPMAWASILQRNFHKSVGVIMWQTIVPWQCGSDGRRKPSNARHLLMVKSRIGDIYIGMLPPEEKSKHPSSTRKRGKKWDRRTSEIGKFNELI